MEILTQVDLSFLQLGLQTPGELIKTLENWGLDHVPRLDRDPRQAPKFLASEPREFDYPEPCAKRSTAVLWIERHAEASEYWQYRRRGGFSWSATCCRSGDLGAPPSAAFAAVWSYSHRPTSNLQDLGFRPAALRIARRPAMTTTAGPEPGTRHSAGTGSSGEVRRIRREPSSAPSGELTPRRPAAP